MDRDVSAAHLTLDRVLANAADGLFVLDTGYRCVWFSPGCERITGTSAPEMLNVIFQGDTTGESSRKAEPVPLERGCPDGRALQSAGGVLKKVLRLRRQDGSSVWVEGHYLALRDERGNFTGLLGLLRPQPSVGLDLACLGGIPEDLPAALERLRLETREKYGFANLFTTLPRVRETLERIRAACTHPAFVLLLGEMGTGKETVARTIHRNGPRNGFRFVAVRCGESRERLERQLFGDSTFEGSVRTADQGILYLEGVGEMPLETQGALAEVLLTQRVRPWEGTGDHPVDLWIIAANRRPLGEAVAAGRFREDLHQHLSALTICMPPLRERREDIPYLVQRHLTELNKRSAYRRIERVHPEVWPWLLRYRWPGNIRELHGVLESAYTVGSGPELRAEDLPQLIRGETLELEEAAAGLDRPLDDVLASVERQAILTALRRTDGRRSQAAREMGISRSRLYRRMEALGIHPREDM